jgi:hypothetical protein
VTEGLDVVVVGVAVAVAAVRRSLVSAEAVVDASSVTARFRRFVVEFGRCGLTREFGGKCIRVDQNFEKRDGSIFKNFLYF